MRQAAIYPLPCILRRKIAQLCASRHGVYLTGSVSTENRRVPERQSAARISATRVALMLTFYSGGLSEFRPIPNRPTSINLIRNRVMAMVLLAALVAACTAVYATDFAVIVHNGNPVKAMPLTDLNKIFRGKTSAWPNGRNIVLVVRDPGSPAMKFILEKVMGVSADEGKAALSDPARNKSGASVTFVSSDQDVVKAVESTPGAIGIIDVYNITSGVKVVKIDEKQPFDPGYVLKGRSQ
jgi:PBP superfamily domain